MRDPNVPTDLRLEMAVAAAPFFHAKPQAPPRVRTNAMGSSPIKSSPDFTQPKVEEELKAAERPGENDGADLSPLRFLLQVMNDPDAAPRQRIKAARVAARFKHPPAPPDKQPAVDEYGFAISGALANAIKDDWFALEGLDASSKDAPKRAEILARQAERDKFLRCPTGYSPEADEKRLGELDPYWPPRKLSKTEGTELAFVIARLAASKAAFNRSPEGRIHRRMDDLQYKRSVANSEKNRRLGLTRVEGKELDEWLEQYRAENPAQQVSIMGDDAVRRWTLREERFKRDRELRRQEAQPGSDPDSAMEELAPTHEELAAWVDQDSRRRRAAGDPDPWDGEAPLRRIHQLEELRYDKKLTLAQKEELEHITLLYPEAVEQIRTMLTRRLKAYYARREYTLRLGYDPGPDEGWPRIG
jgi:hypothetical protein